MKQRQRDAFPLTELTHATIKWPGKDIQESPRKYREI